MLKVLEEFYSRSPAKRQVAEKFLRLGLRVDGDGVIFCADVEIAPAKLARALSIDRRVVIQAAQEIAQDEQLFKIFSRLEPRAFIARAASEFGFDVLEIHADPHATGVVAAVTSTLARDGVNIRQVISDDPDLFPDPVLSIITHKPLRGASVERVRKLSCVNEVAWKKKSG